MKCEYCGGVICCEVCQRVPEDDTLRSRVAELEALLQQHQTYQTKQGEKK